MSFSMALLFFHKNSRVFVIIYFEWSGWRIPYINGIKSQYIEKIINKQLKTKSAKKCIILVYLVLLDIDIIHKNYKFFFSS
jgi:hypothetical protein